MFGKTIAAFRERKDLSQWDLSLASGISRSYISRLETGQMTPSLGEMEKLAIGLGVPIADIFANRVPLAPFIQELWDAIFSVPAERRRAALKTLSILAGCEPPLPESFCSPTGIKSIPQPPRPKETPVVVVRPSAYPGTLPAGHAFAIYEAWLTGQSSTQAARTTLIDPRTVKSYYQAFSRGLGKKKLTLVERYKQIHPQSKWSSIGDQLAALSDGAFFTVMPPPNLGASEYAQQIRNGLNGLANCILAKRSVAVRGNIIAITRTGTHEGIKSAAMREIDKSIPHPLTSAASG